MTTPPEKTAWIIGNGGHARVIASLLPHARIRHLVERDPGPDDRLQAEFFVTGPEPGDYYIGIGDNIIRRRYFDRLAAMGIVPARLVAPTAWIAPDAKLGAGAFVGLGAIVGAGASLGVNVIVNNLSLVDHDCRVGDDSQIAIGVAVAGGVRIGRGCFVAMGSCVVPRIEIGDGAYVMAGAVVVKAVPAGARVGGVPARLMPAAGAPGEGSGSAT